MAALKETKDDIEQCRSLEFFKSLTLFANMSDKEVALFSDASHAKAYKKGSYLYREGEPAKFFYIICDGWLKLSRMTEIGEEVSFAMLTRDGITAESAIFEQGLFSNNAQVVEDAHILSIPLSILKEQLRVNTQLAFNMFTSMVQYQRLHELQLEQYHLYSAPQRIGCFLLGLCPVQEQKDGVILNLPYDKTLIASTLGMKGATFSRALNILREATGLHITGSKVKIDSIKRLLKFVGSCYSPLPLPGKIT